MEALPIPLTLGCLQFGPLLGYSQVRWWDTGPLYPIWEIGLRQWRWNRMKKLDGDTCSTEERGQQVVTYSRRETEWVRDRRRMKGGSWEMGLEWEQPEKKTKTYFLYFQCVSFFPLPPAFLTCWSSHLWCLCTFELSRIPSVSTSANQVCLVLKSFSSSSRTCSFHWCYKGKQERILKNNDKVWYP